MANISLGGLGANLGSALGTGLAQPINQGLDILAEHKLGQLQRSQFEKGLAPIIGKEEAQFLAALGPDERKYALQNLNGVKQLINQIKDGGVNALAQQTEAQPQLDQQVPGQDQRTQLIQDIFTSPQEKREREKFKFKEEEAKFKRQQTITPFLNKQAEQFNAERQANHYASQMLANIKKNKAKWPGLIRSLGPEALIRDKDVRKYTADANNLVTALAGTRKGVPTNFKLKLEQLAKANLTQPIETQMEILDDVVKTFKQEKKRQKFIDSLKDKETGEYPLDIARRVLDHDIEQEEKSIEPQTVEQLPPAEKYAGKNVEATNPSTGEKMEVKQINGKWEWVPVKG